MTGVFPGTGTTTEEAATTRGSSTTRVSAGSYSGSEGSTANASTTGSTDTTGSVAGTTGAIGTTGEGSGSTGPSLTGGEDNGETEDTWDPDNLPRNCGWLQAGMVSYYDCNGEGLEPSMTYDINCPDETLLLEGGPCGDISGIGCCDANGNNWFCGVFMGDESLWNVEC